jgi:hypothetical protein
LFVSVIVLQGFSLFLVVVFRTDLKCPLQLGEMFGLRCIFFSLCIIMSRIRHKPFCSPSL